MNAKPIPVALSFVSADEEKKLRHIVSSVSGFELVASGSADPAVLRIQEVGPDAEREIERIARLTATGCAGEVILAARNLDTALLLAAMRAGVKECLALPLSQPECVQALERVRARMEGPAACGQASRGRVTTIMGVKGGIGSTTIAVNLAAALNRANPGSVVVIDLHQPMGEVPFFLDLEYKFTWADMAHNLDRLDPTFLMSLLAKHASGLYVLPSPAFDGAELSAEAMATLLDLAGRMFDHVIVDAAFDVDEASMKLMEATDTLCMVMVLSLPCLARTRKLVELAGSLNEAVAKKMQFCVNRHLSSAEIGVAEAESVLGRKVDWLVPNDYKLALAAVNQGKTVHEIAPKSPLAKAFADMVKGMPVRPAAKQGKGSFISSLFGRKAPAAA